MTLQYLYELQPPALRGAAVKLILCWLIGFVSLGNITDDEFGVFCANPGLAMKVLKYQDAGAENIIQGESYCDVDRDTADFLNGYLHLDLVYEEPEEEGIDMCKGMEDYTRETELRGEIKGLKKMGMSAQQIVEMIMEDYQVSREYVEKLM